MLVALACEILMNELQAMGTDDATMQKIRGMVERILAKCRQSGCNLLGLVGVTLAQSPTKGSSNFVDMHAEGTRANKSFHFHINEMKQPSKTEYQQDNKAKPSGVNLSNVNH
jgi:hypothetical protein